MRKRDATLKRLMDGNRRFVEGKSGIGPVTQAHLEELSKAQHPIAAVVACSDSRVSPEIIFDQPLGNLFVSRVPANVASDSAKWMIDIAVGEFKVPVLLVMGHSGCLAVQQVLAGTEGSGGLLRYQVQAAALEAKRQGEHDLLTRAVEENARRSAQKLREESSPLRDACRNDQILIQAAFYDMRTGTVRLLD